MAPFPAAIRALELPTVQVVGPWQAMRPTRKAILGGHCYVYGSKARLAPPIDWRQDPHGSRTWCYELHTLTWLKEALARHAVGGDTATLAVARDVVLDWIGTHPPSKGDSDSAISEEQSEFAWYDMAVGLRAPYIAYVLQACLAEEILAEGDAELLLEAAQRHGAFLARGENYVATNNHGLFEDEGLYLLARLLPELPTADAWREMALIRMKANLEATVSFADGAHLEHSPAYQLAILDLVARLANNVAELPELRPLLERMRRTAAWQTTPTGRMAQLGDTDDLPAPRWARDAARSLRGMNVLAEAGQVYVRDGDSYLAVSTAYHSDAHKHSDDTGFLLVEGGQTILGDTGRWGYYEEEPDRLYARSAAAHNVLTVDSEDFDWRGTEPYGSGLEGAKKIDGGYTIRVRNPLLAQQGVEHRRTLHYRPEEALNVVDEVSAADTHEYARHFHFGPGMDAKKDGAGRVVVQGADVVAVLSAPDEGTEVELCRGRENSRCGWTYPGDRERTAVWTVTLRSRGRDAQLRAMLQLNGRCST